MGYLIDKFHQCFDRVICPAQDSDGVLAFLVFLSHGRAHTSKRKSLKCIFVYVLLLLSCLI